jgi:hypothetical protein
VGVAGEETVSHCTAVLADVKLEARRLTVYLEASIFDPNVIILPQNK